MKRYHLIALLMLILVISGCAPAPAPSAEPPALPEQPAVNEPVPPADDGLPVMTLEELAKYNGKDHENIYIAVDGLIYDVTNIKPWSTGVHQGKVTAGTDGSEMILQSPHGKKVLEKLEVVGKLKQ